MEKGDNFQSTSIRLVFQPPYTPEV